MVDRNFPSGLFETIARSLDRPAPGEHHDLWAIYRSPHLLEQVIELLCAPFETAGITHVAGIEARGLCLGPLAAAHLSVPFIPIRKIGGFLPGKRLDARTAADWSGKTSTLEIQAHALLPGSRVLLVDDWLTTGSQARTAVELVSRLDSRIHAVATIVEEFEKGGNANLPGVHALLNWNDSRGTFVSSHFLQGSQKALENASRRLGRTFLADLTSRAQAILPTLGLTQADVLEISRRRDYAERLRFRVKSEVDEGLKVSQVTAAEQTRIRTDFASGALSVQLARYEARLDTVLRLVQSALEAGLASARSASTSGLIQTWADLAWATGLDNAHAMYLASGNWGFTVFDRTLTALDSVVDPDSRTVLMTAGLQDARTFVPARLADLPRPRSRRQFIETLFEHGLWTLENGIVPAVCFEAASVTARSARSLRAIGERNAKRFQDHAATVPLEAQEPLGVYRELYRLRQMYDTYEYFGLYAFMRHALIVSTERRVAERSSRAAARFARLASLYQYESATQVLVEAVKG